MDIQDNLELYTKCWLDLRLFLYCVASDLSDDYPYVDDVLHLMEEIERKYYKY